MLQESLLSTAMLAKTKQNKSGKSHEDISKSIMDQRTCVKGLLELVLVCLLYSGTRIFSSSDYVRGL